MTIHRKAYKNTVLFFNFRHSKSTVYSIFYIKFVLLIKNALADQKILKQM